MKEYIIYQTLTDRDNPDYIADYGPFKCTHDKSWLGTGYYFWDTFIENAHWWGKESLKRPYVICEAKISLDDNNCFDLVSNTDHLRELREVYKILKSKNLAKPDTTVARIINYLIEIDKFPYSCVRVNPISSKSYGKNSDYLLQFHVNNSAYIDTIPPIQICIYNLKKVNFRDFNIVYPDVYIDGYVV